MKLWIDDVRPAPDGYVLVKSVRRAKWAIETVEAKGGTIELIDIDHDAGDCVCVGDGHLFWVYTYGRLTRWKI